MDGCGGGVVCCWSAERCWGVTGGDECGGVEDGIWRCRWRGCVGLVGGAIVPAENGMMGDDAGGDGTVVRRSGYFENGLMGEGAGEVTHARTHTDT